MVSRNRGSNISLNRVPEPPVFEMGEHARVLPLTHPGFGIINFTSRAFATGGEDYANGAGLRRSLWLDVGSVRQRRRAKTGPTAAPCTAITAALLSPSHAGCRKHGEAARGLFCT